LPPPPPFAGRCSHSPWRRRRRRSSDPYLIWLDAAKIDVAKVMGLPPAQNSPEHRAEFEKVLAISSARTPEREKQAIADQYQTLNAFVKGMDHTYVDGHPSRDAAA
jgi:hypothetical protein